MTFLTFLEERNNIQGTVEVNESALSNNIKLLKDHNIGWADFLCFSKRWKCQSVGYYQMWSIQKACISRLRIKKQNIVICSKHLLFKQLKQTLHRLASMLQHMSQPKLNNPTGIYYWHSSSCKKKIQTMPEKEIHFCQNNPECFI